MPTNPDPELMRIFDFTADDLEANRAGHIAERQAQRLLKYVALFPSLFLDLAYFVVIVVIFRNAGTALFLIIPLELILFIVVISIAMHNRQIIVSDLGLGEVINISGSISRRSRRNGGDIIISDRTLKISLYENKELKKYLGGIASQIQFRVYYIPRSKKILSIEAI